MALRGQFDGVFGLDFSPDNRRLVSASENRGPILWDLATGQVAFSLLPDSAGPPRVRFTPDGYRIVMAARIDVSVWDNRNPTEPTPDERIKRAITWHTLESQRAEQRRYPFAVLHHLRQLPDSLFDDVRLSESARWLCQCPIAKLVRRHSRSHNACRRR